MNNDDLHINKSSNHYNYSMQNINSSNDDSCIDLLEMINMDDNSSNNGVIDGSDMKENDRFCQEIMSALEKKDFQRIATLALSQSQGGQKMGMILNETMLALEKSSSKTVDSNIIEKITSIIRAQPKNSSSVLRATVAPIRNESIVCSSSTSIGNFSVVPTNPGSKSSSHVTRYSGNQDMSEHDWNALFSPSTPPTTPSMSFVQFNGQGMMHSGYGGVQYQPGFIGNNGIVCIVTPTNGSAGNTDHVTVQQSHGYMGGGGGGVPVTCAMSSSMSSSSTSITTDKIGPTSLPRILPRPGNRVIAPKTQYTPQYIQSTMAINNAQPSTFKRPPSSSSGGSRRVTGSGQAGRQCKTAKAGRGSKARDNIMMAWQNAEESLTCDDHVTNQCSVGMVSHHSSFLSQLEQDGSLDGGHVTDCGSLIDNIGSITINSNSNNNNIIDQYTHMTMPSINDIFAGLEDLLLDPSVTSVADTMGTVTNSRVHVPVLVTLDVDPGTSCLIIPVVVSHTVYRYYDSSPVLSRATVSNAPRQYGPVSMTVVQCAATNNSIVPSLSSSHNVTEDTSRIVQLLYAHLGRHTHADLLTPWFKCLQPLSVATRLSDQDCDLMTEEEYSMQDETVFSPVKRDPSHLANLDRILQLESCHVPLMPVCTTSNRLPYQADDHDGGIDTFLITDNNTWLRRGHRGHRTKWSKDGQVLGHMVRAQQGMVPGVVVLRKKSNYRQSGGDHVTRTNARIERKKQGRNIKYDQRMKEIREENSRRRETNGSSGLLKIRIQLAKRESAVGAVESTSVAVHQEEERKKKIFCTRKEERRSSNVHSTRSPSKSKVCKAVATTTRNNPRLIMKLCSTNKGVVDMDEVERVDKTGTSDSIKLLIRRSGQTTYKSEIASTGSALDEEDREERESNYQYSSTSVDLVPPPSHQHRPRPQQAVLQFSPAHSSTDSDIGVAHQEISCLLQRQEQREPLVDSGTAVVVSASTGSNQSTFPSLPVPYLIGSDPTVFMDPHEVELLVVKNSRYKKIAAAAVTTAASAGRSGTVQPPLNLFADAGSTDLFVPGCFVEQDKHSLWSSSGHHPRSSPSMPVLAPQEPFTASAATNTSKDIAKTSHPLSHTSYPYRNYTNDSIADYSQSSTSHQSQSFSDQSDRIQQSPLCMATTHNVAQYPSATQIDLMPPDPHKSPSAAAAALAYRQQSYHYPANYSHSSCYLNESVNQAMLQSSTATSSSNSNQSKNTNNTNQMQSPVTHQQTTSVSSVCTSQLPDYSYFHNSTHPSLQSLAGTDSSVFATPSSNYQPIPDLCPQPSAKTSKRSSSSSRTHSLDPSSLLLSSSSSAAASSSSKKRKESSVQPPAPPLQSALSMYSNNSDLYSAAAHYSGLDYYGSGFSNILGNMDQIKLYEQYAREYTLQFGSFCPPTMPWSNAMAEYCKQAAALNPSSVAGVTSPNPLSSSSVVNNNNTNINLGHTNTDYTNPYTAYAMSQPYSMYSTFGMPK